MKTKKKKRTNKKRNLRIESEEFRMLDHDEYHYFIAGYTDGRFSYGITWEEYFRDIHEFVDGDFYYICEAGYDGKVIGVTWKAYLKQLDKDLLELSQEGDYFI